AGTVTRNTSWESGIALWEDSVAKEPTRLRAWNELAMAHYHTRFEAPEERPEKAIELLNKALELNPNYVRGLSNLGAVLADLGRDGEAIEALERMSRSPEAIPKGTVQLLLLYERAGKHDEALALARRVEK